jgi:hypothetical protein
MSAEELVVYVTFGFFGDVYVLLSNVFRGLPVPTGEL